MKPLEWEKKGHRLFWIQNLQSSFRIIQSDSFNCSKNLESRVDELWQAALSFTDSRLFNGLIFSASSVESGVITGSFVEYKYLIAQRMDPRLKAKLNIQPVSLLGYVKCQDGILFGKRQNWLATRPDEWGFLPSEYISPDSFFKNGEVDYVKTFLQALKNEINIDAHFLTDLCHAYLIQEQNALENHIYVVMSADIALSSLAVKRAHLCARHDEYEQIKALPLTEVASFLDAEKGQDIAIARAILEQKSYLTLESRSA